MKEVIEMRIGTMVWKAQMHRITARRLYRIGSEQHKEYRLKAEILMEAARIMYGPGAKARNERKKERKAA